jgi:NAD(P)-dependent dehydrogenase (short-subunit alcohol dehydrogenase family)
MLMLLKNQVAVVTGAGNGIGREIALKLRQAGARVVVSDLLEDGGVQTVNDLRKQGGEAICFKADTSSPEENEAFVKAAVTRFGALHVAVNIAGTMAPIAEYPLDGQAKVLPRLERRLRLIADWTVSLFFTADSAQVRLPESTDGATALPPARALPAQAVR